MPPPEGGSGNASKFHENAAKSWFVRIFAEFSRKFALEVHEGPYGVGVRFFWPQMKRFVDTNNFQHIFVRVHAIAAKTWACFCTLLNLEVSWNWRFHEISMRYPTLPQEGVFMETLIWANAICNAKFDWISLKETKSTYENGHLQRAKRVFPIWALP